jgi:hypothetical protein
MIPKTNLIDKCKEAEPYQKNIITTAIRILESPAEMRQFYQECINLISKISDEETEYMVGLVNKECELRELQQLPKRINSEEIAGHLLSYVLSAFDPQTIQNWKKAIPKLPKVIHPVPHYSWRYLSDWIILDDDYGFRKP